MPVGTAERAFAAAALVDGITLLRARVPWLNQRGHLGLPEPAWRVRQPLAEIFEALDGSLEDQAAKGTTSLPGDFFHERSGRFIEVDEVQHFTSFRSLALEIYPDETPLGFDLARYRQMCEELAPTADRFFASKAARGFGPGGRQRQRAYHDSLRDLVVPVMGAPPVIRIPVLNGRGGEAYEESRLWLRDLLL